jgi:hypothetical protein
LRRRSASAPRVSCCSCSPPRGRTGLTRRSRSIAANDITELLKGAAFAFHGTVEQVGAATIDAFPADDRTVVVRVDEVLSAPEPFARLAGSTVTLRLAEDAPLLRAGDTGSFFANGVAFGESLALQEVGRLPADDVRRAATAEADRGDELALQSLQREVVTQQLREHAAGADAVVIGRVVALRRAAGPPLREHDPDWWVATLEVGHVQRGDVAEGKLEVLYPNSIDVRWREVPKPQAGQDGLWILHATGDDLRALAPFRILHEEDLQEPQLLEALR